MSDAIVVHELQPVAVGGTLLFAVLMFGQILVAAARRFKGRISPDFADWSPTQILAERRFGLALDLSVAAAWASVAIALLRFALRAGVVPLLASHLGPLPIPPWFALVLQEGHRLGLTFAIWATCLWLDRSISKHWSHPRNRPGGQSFLATLLALLAVVMSVLS